MRYEKLIEMLCEEGTLEIEREPTAQEILEELQ